MPATPEIVLERHPFELRVLTQIAKTLTSRLPLKDLLQGVFGGRVRKREIQGISVFGDAVLTVD